MLFYIFVLFFTFVISSLAMFLFLRGPSFFTSLDEKILDWWYYRNKPYYELKEVFKSKFLSKNGITSCSFDSAELQSVRFMSEYSDDFIGPKPEFTDLELLQLNELIDYIHVFDFCLPLSALATLIVFLMIASSIMDKELSKEKYKI